MPISSNTSTYEVFWRRPSATATTPSCAKNYSSQATHKPLVTCTANALSSSVARRTPEPSSFITQVQRQSTIPTPSKSAAVERARQSSIAAAALLLPSSMPHYRHRPLLVLDLDETLVHASVERCVAHDACFVVDMGSQQITVYVKVRPFAKEFLRRVAQLFEVCIFTASLAPYADQVVDYLDPSRKHVHHRLFREHCTNIDGSYIKDLTLLGRAMERVAIVDNSPVAYSFQPENAIPVTSWFDDATDNELLGIMPMLEHFASSCDIYATNKKYQQPLLRR